MIFEGAYCGGIHRENLTEYPMEQKKRIKINRHEILLGQRKNTAKSFPHILGKEKENLGVLCHKTTCNMKSYNN